jgi:hypothetical protein
LPQNLILVSHTGGEQIKFASSGEEKLNFRCQTSQ